jgi:hypothetical protein
LPNRRLGNKSHTSQIEDGAGRLPKETINHLELETNDQATILGNARHNSPSGEFPREKFRLKKLSIQHFKPVG